MLNSTQRFSARVDDYVKYRPDYPEAALDELTRRVGARFPLCAADIGSGTGIFSRGLLARGFTVHAVEPNREMREAAERTITDPRFVSHDARAEATGLSDQSVAAVFAAQAFHWFDAPACRREWARILQTRGLVGLIWNERKLGSPFMDAYEAVLSEGNPEYAKVTHRQLDGSAIARFFAPAPFEKLEYDNAQSFDWDGLRGRALSSSYVPRAGEPGHDDFLARLQRLYDQHQSAGEVRFDYVTAVYVGTLAV
jgi:SAM-dependent methyltransferase